LECKADFEAFGPNEAALRLIECQEAIFLERRQERMQGTATPFPRSITFSIRHPTEKVPIAHL
jgi:hypothetical protein